MGNCSLNVSVREKQMGRKQSGTNTICQKRLFLVGGIIFFFCLVCLFFKFIYFIYLCLAVLGLRCCMRAFSSCGEWRLLFVSVHRLIAVATLVAEHGL